jgi:ribosome biogenesis GTPase
MHLHHLSSLQRLGLTPAVLQSLLTLAQRFAEAPARPARLVTVHRETCAVHDGAELSSGRVHPQLAGSTLAVGDWVLLVTDAHGAAWLTARAEPASEIVRRDADGMRHVVVSNVDVAFIVMGLDGDFNPRRAERYVALVRSGGAGIEPVLVLTKRDWAGDAVAEDEADAMRRRLGIAVEAVNGLDPAAAARLGRYIAPGQTAVLLGSSGAGKSTLTNTLVGTSVEDTGAVRAADDRGKHTTTHRALYVLPGGGCIIDTPGVRTLRPDVDAAALGAAFGDIEALAAQCRFRDCRHQDEPGCAVRAGVHPDRLANWHKLGRELRRDALTILDRQRQLAEWKARSRGARERMRLKRGE